MKKRFNWWIFVMGLALVNFCWGDVWERQAADSTGSDLGEYCSLVIDSKDNPHIAYYDWVFRDLRYAYLENGVWHIEIVDSIGNTGEYCSIALDAQDRPHISYWLKYLGHYPSLGYATRTDTGWAKVIVDTGKDTTYEVSDDYTSIVVNSQGYPLITYVRDYPDKIMCAYQDANGWHKTEVWRLYDSWFTKIRLSSQGQPVIGFNEWIQYPDDYEQLKVAYLNPSDSTWNLVMVPDTAYFSSYGTMVDFDLDSQNRAYFIYLNNQWDWMLAIYDGSDWQLEKFIPDEYWPQSNISLAINRLGKPTLAFLDYGIRIIWAQKENGQWQFHFVDEGIDPDEISMAFDSQNFPRLAVYGETLNYTRYALFYYRYWPGDPLIVLPEPSHDFGLVWTRSYADWNCPVENHGDAPLILSELNFTSNWWDTAFQVVNTPLPQTILPQQTGAVTIRFKPFAEQTFFDTLLITSNDSLNLESMVTVQGSGTISGTSGTLLLSVKNIYIDHPHQMLKSDQPLKQAAVSLYQSGVRKYGPLQTDHAGQVNFPMWMWGIMI